MRHPSEGHSPAAASPPTFHKLLQTHLKTSSICFFQQLGSVQGYSKEMAPLSMDLGLSMEGNTMGLCVGSGASLPDFLQVRSHEAY